MRSAIIHKQLAAGAQAPNLADYAAERRSFSWAAARAELDGLPGDTGLNIAHEAVDRHARGPARDRVALRHIDVSGSTRDYTYADLRTLTNRFASALGRLGVGRGETVFALTGRVPELYATALGALKAGALFCPLFSAFGPEPIRARLAAGNARVLVTTGRLYQRKVAPIVDELPHLEHVLLVASDAVPPGTRSLAAVLADGADEFEVPPTDPEDPALLFFTSGTTGTPKGAVHSHEAVVGQYASARLALDLRPGDRFWCTADPGWVTGTVYGILAPLVVGATVVVDEAEFDALRWLRILQDEAVAVWYTAPTAVRMLMRLGSDVVAGHDLAGLRHVACVGEMLDADAVLWAQETLGQPLHDTWWQTETGSIMIANFAATDIKPGAMGLPMPGIEAAIVEVGDDGNVQPVAEPGATGQLALRAPWPSMFRSYFGDDERYRACFAEGWYLTGDLARQDGDGYFWFVGRADDVIKSAGHLIGPAEVEAVLDAHPAVHEAAAIGVPHPVAGEVVKAFVVVKADVTADDRLTREVMAHARRLLGPAVAPKELEFRTALPKTRSGKILRRLLKARELGLPTGDLSTLLDPERPGD